MFLVTDLKNMFSDIFKKNDVQDDQEGFIEDNSIGQSQEQMDLYSNGVGEINQSNISFTDLFTSKKDRISFYKCMSLYPEVNDSLDNICDDAIIDNSDGVFVSLGIKKELKKLTDKKVKKEFDYLLNSVFKFRDRGWELFRKWLVESELYLEVVLNKKKNGIGAIKILPAHTMSPIYDGNKIIKFVQVIEGSTTQGVDNSTTKYFEPNQILYINYGIYGKNLLDVRGYLEPSIRPYNQLKSLEDSLIVYRLVRAPERRVWNIDVGRMPPGKAEEYIKKLILKYKKKLNYNSETGAVNSSQSFQSMTEDFWFAKTETGGSTVDSLQSGMNLGEIEDVNYFLKKLYKTLKLPRSRWEENANFDAGTMGETTREEVKFSRFISRLQNRFKKLFSDSLMLQLKLKKIDSKVIDPDNFDYDFVESNLFKSYKDKQHTQQMIDIWSSMSSYVATPDNASSDGVFSREYVMRKFMGMSEDDYDENWDMRSKELNRLDKDFPKEEVPDEDEDDEDDDNIEDV